MPESLTAQITEAMKAALRAGDKARLSAIRLMLSEIKRVEVDERRELSDSDTHAILNRMLKQRRDSAQQYRAGNRPELADREDAEIRVIEGFLPAGLSEADITGLVDAAITEAGASGPQAMGAVMALLKPRLAGRADMARVSALVKARLAG